MNTVMALILCLLSVTATAQVSHVTIAGHAFRAYEVENNKETLYGIAQKLGVSQEEILRFNPDVSQGVQKKQLVFVPAKSAAEQVSQAFGQTETYTVSSAKSIRHTIAVGENLYTLAKRFNVTVEGLFSANPKLTPGQFVPGQEIKVTPNTAMPFYYDRTVIRFHNYKVQSGDSYSALAARYGVTQADLQAANPSMSKPKKGKNIVIPRPSTERVLGDMQTIALDDLQNYYEPRLSEIHATIKSQRRSEAVNIGLVLPFQLHKESAPRQAYLYTDFYKGMLLALDSAAATCTRRINLHVWDTEHNLNVTDSLLALPKMREMDLIIAPSEPQQLKRINKFGTDNQICVLNCFTAKNEDYLESDAIVQVNTPSPLFTERVLEWFDRQFADYEVIYLIDSSGDDKEAFTAIQQHLSAKSKPSVSINVGGELSSDNLSRQMDPATKYVVIPSSSSKETLRKVVKALKRVKEERFDCEIAMLGYPEYVLYLKDHQTELQDIDTYLFSRFFNSKGFRTRDIEAAYKHWFGGEMLSSTPNMGIYGFDTGMYLIKTLGQGIDIDEQAPLHRGVQTSFKFQRASSGSLLNRAIDIVHFSTDHKITTYVNE